MGNPEPEDFYVGYAESLPAATRKVIRVAVTVLLLGAMATAVALTAWQQPFGPGVFEFGTEREFGGWVRERPAPVLVVAAPGRARQDGPPVSAYPLTRYGSKLGAQELVAGLDGRLIRLRGVLIYRDDQTMVDVVPGSVFPVELTAARHDGATERDPAAPRDPAAQREPPAPDQLAVQRDVAEEPDLSTRGGVPEARAEDLGTQTLRGEIVDSKCFLGVMKPGSGKVHRACAVRCISSGAPPLLVARDRRGETLHLLLVGRDGQALGKEILAFVAEPVEITGRVVRYDNLLVLQGDPSAIRRL